MIQSMDAPANNEAAITESCGLTVDKLDDAIHHPPSTVIVTNFKIARHSVVVNYSENLLMSFLLH